mmetsp:Transcript_30241/g.48808  ORF Transcript_30241/g.48808 Transcript_30241/m.48808 type:complete len:293 (+) Transcript_30241:159-1037(+)
MMQSSRRRTLLLVLLCVVGAASELVQVKRKRLLEFEVSWEAKAASSFRMEITAPAVKIERVQGELVTEKVFVRDGLSSSPVLVNNETAVEWKLPSGETFGGLIQDTPYTIAVYHGTEQLDAVYAMPLVRSSAPTNVRVCGIKDDTYPCRKVEIKESSLRVSFESPKYFGGDLSGPLEYVVEVCPAADFAGGVVRSEVHAHAGNVFEIASVGGLKPSVYYWARVRAITEVGDGDVSQISSNSGQVPTVVDAANRQKVREHLAAQHAEEMNVIRQRAGSHAADYLGVRNVAAEL